MTPLEVALIIAAVLGGLALLVGVIAYFVFVYRVGKRVFKVWDDMDKLSGPRL